MRWIALTVLVLLVAVVIVGCAGFLKGAKNEAEGKNAPDGTGPEGESGFWYVLGAWLVRELIGAGKMYLDRRGGMATSGEIAPKG